MERRLVWVALLMLGQLALAGCHAVQTYNPLSQSHGLPAQSE